MSGRSRVAAGLGLAVLGSVSRSRGPGAEKAKTLTSGVESSGFDPAVRPQDDLFGHVNGKWVARTEIPPERDGVWRVLHARRQGRGRRSRDCRGRRQDARCRRVRGQKVGDLFGSFMDEARVDSLGLEPIKAELAQIDAVKDKANLINALGSLQARGPRASSGRSSTLTTSSPTATSSI